MSDDSAVMTMTVNDAIQRYPATVAVFDRHGIDSCCGGSAPVVEAAQRHGIEITALRQELLQAIGTGA